MRLSSIVLGVCVLLASIASEGGSVSASGPKPPGTPLLPGISVVEWFPHRVVRVGDLARVDARFTVGTSPQAGAQLTTTVKQGKRVLKVIKGTKTDRKGHAEVRFKVPTAWHKERVQVFLTVRWHGQSVTSSDFLTIR